MKINKNGEAYIDTIITIFLSIVIIAISINLFKLVYTYQKVNDAATAIVQYAAVKGEILAADDATKKEELKGDFQKYIEKILKYNGLSGLNLEYTFVGSDLINADDNKVQYGDSIVFRIKATAKIGVIDGDGSIEIPISLSKTSISEKYYK